MAGFTLIHGSTQNATAWIDVAARLRRSGHTVATPDLPKNEPSWSLSRYAEFIQHAIANAHPRVLVAHSFSGVFLPLVASHAQVLVFEAAVIPESGRSVYDQFSGDRSMFAPSWIAAGARWFDPAQRPALAREFLFHDCDPAAVPLALATIELFDTRHLVMERTPLDVWPDTACHTIVCAGDRTLSPAWSRAAAERVNAALIELQGGHCPHTSRPQDVASILEGLARLE